MIASGNGHAKDNASGRRSRLAEWWFRPRRIEHAGSIYRPLGVRHAKKILMLTLGRTINSANYSLEGRHSEALRRFERWTIVNETYHLALFCVFAVSCAWIFVHGGRFSLQLVLLGCVLNLYLVALQRYNRARIWNVLDRVQAHERLRDQYRSPRHGHAQID
jgi:hypothetical protein